MIRSSRHSLSNSNIDKLKLLSEFLNEYRKISQELTDYIWANGWKQNNWEFDVKNNKLNLAPMLTSDIVQSAGIKTKLSGRALKCCMTQVSGMIRAEVEKQSKRIYVLNKKKKEGVSKKRLKNLIKKLKENIPQKPNCSNIKAELNSICIDIKDGAFFDKFIQLKSIFKTRERVKFPFNFHKHAIELKNKSVRMLNSVMISDNYIDLRWEIEEPKKKETGETVGGDQGYKDVLNIANANYSAKTPSNCPHGHSLESIIEKASRKRKGSRAFKRAKEHQKNFINWSLNNINLNNIKQINLEKIWNIGYKSGRSRKMSHWQNTLIRDKVICICETNGVHFVEQSSTYKSQRCFSCGNVRKSNRKGRVYECKNCGNIDDADHNAALNHSINLPEIPYDFRKLNLNRKDGFIWNLEGVFDLDGRRLQSLPHVES
jgi:transposase